MAKRIFIVMPAYNVSHYIEGVVKRIPRRVWNQLTSLVIVNDGSTDSTGPIVKTLLKRYPKIHLINNKRNKGYAQTQKTGFKYALNNNADIVALLHSDGQYAPEELPKLLKPLQLDKADVVQGSRTLKGGALEGNMPLYKYIANRVLSKLENIVYDMNISEYHSGYMVYSRKALKMIPFNKLSDTFHFDGEMLFMSHKKKLRFMEVAIETHYRGERSNLIPILYGLQVLKIMFDYKRGRYNI
jgi:glycosyltransferase involved in cell wall biosynthesis